MKNVLITGVSGGMGLATAKELVKQGYEVYGLDIKEIEGFPGFHFYKTDTTNEESIDESFKQIKSHIDNLSSIIHFAGIYDLNSLIEMSEEDFTKIFNINVFSVYRINKRFIDTLEKGGKIIITTSELASLDPLPFTGVYAITKSALDKYAYSLRMEVQLLDYKVVVLRPGAVSTGMINVSTDKLEKFSKSTTHYQYNAKKFKEIVDKVESKTIPPEKIANLVSKILIKRNPKYVYKINQNLGLKLLNILPRRLQNKIIKNIISK